MKLSKNNARVLIFLFMYSFKSGYIFTLPPKIHLLTSLQPSRFDSIVSHLVLIKALYKKAELYKITDLGVRHIAYNFPLLLPLLSTWTNDITWLMYQGSKNEPWFKDYIRNVLVNQGFKNWSQGCWYCFYNFSDVFSKIVDVCSKRGIKIIVSKAHLNEGQLKLLVHTDQISKEAEDILNSLSSLSIITKSQTMKRQTFVEVFEKFSAIVGHGFALPKKHNIYIDVMQSVLFDLIRCMNILTKSKV